MRTSASKRSYSEVCQEIKDLNLRKITLEQEKLEIVANSTFKYRPAYKRPKNPNDEIKVIQRPISVFQAMSKKKRSRYY